MEYQFGQLSCPGCVFSQPLAQPTYCWGAKLATQGLESVQALFSNRQNTGVLSILFWSQIQNPALYRVL